MNVLDWVDHRSAEIAQKTNTSIFMLPFADAVHTPKCDHYDRQQGLETAGGGDTGVLKVNSNAFQAANPGDTAKSDRLGLVNEVLYKPVIEIRFGLAGKSHLQVKALYKLMFK